MDASDSDARESFKSLAVSLHAHEQMLCNAYATGARLATAAHEARMKAQLSATTGHQFLRLVTESSSGVAAALSSIAEGHRLLEQLGRRLGYDPAAYGDGIKDPQQAFTTADGGHLKVVG